MHVKRHGISIGMERVGSIFFLSLKVVGKLTHEDYSVINPLIDSALEGVKDPKVTALIDCSELEGWELRAAWDDFKLGLRHGNEFDRIAILGNKGWQKMASGVASWFTSGQLKYFEDYGEAMQWLSSTP